MSVDNLDIEQVLFLFFEHRASGKIEIFFNYDNRILILNNIHSYNKACLELIYKEL